MVKSNQISESEGICDSVIKQISSLSTNFLTFFNFLQDSIFLVNRSSRKSKSERKKEKEKRKKKRESFAKLKIPPW